MLAISRADGKLELLTDPKPQPILWRSIMAFDAHSIPAPIVEHPAVGRARLRRKLERAIDRLILALDVLDGDGDLEPDGTDEPSLSFRLAIDQDNAIRTEPCGWPFEIDLEDQCEDEGVDTDREPEEEDRCVRETGEGPQ
jgi:hypothetical protein